MVCDQSNPERWDCGQLVGLGVDLKGQTNEVSGEIVRHVPGGGSRIGPVRRPYSGVVIRVG